MDAAGQIRSAKDERYELRRRVGIVHALDPVPRDDELDSYDDDGSDAEVAEASKLLQGVGAVLGDTGPFV